MPDDFGETLSNGTIVGKRYKVIQKLGEGGCGAVFKVEDIEEKGSYYALKVEFASADAGNVLKMEVQILNALASKRHVAKCIASGKRESFSYMVMTLLGDSLESLQRKHGPFLNVSTQVRVGICLLFGIKQIHDIGYIHRDLKPANVALGYKGTSEERYLMVLDFGLSRQFVTEDNKMMRRPREKALFRGTSRYCSIAMHERYEQGRVDDLWALVYILAEIRCELPWSEVAEKVEIGEMKKKTEDKVLFAKSPVQMLDFVSIVRQTGFYNRPNYEALFGLLNDTMVKAGYKWSEPYHWEPEKKDHMDWLPKYSTILGPSFRGARNKKKKEKAISPNAGTKTSEGGEDVPFFTAEDFKSNPLGF